VRENLPAPQLPQTLSPGSTNFPASQSRQAAILYCKSKIEVVGALPSGHELHIVADVSEYFPLSQATHAEALIAPVEGWYVLLGHEVQDEPAESEYLPAMHV
jgi:hypothetical protein